MTKVRAIKGRSPKVEVAIAKAMGEFRARVVQLKQATSIYALTCNIKDSNCHSVFGQSACFARANYSKPYCGDRSMASLLEKVFVAVCL